MKAPIILLTACINPNGMSYTALQDCDERLRQYRETLDRYLLQVSNKIVFVENTGFDMAPMYRDVIKSGRLEVLSFQGNDFDKRKGKGFGEALILQYAMDHSEFIKEASMVVKISGRYQCLNISRILSTCVAEETLYTIACYEKWIDSKLFACPPSFLKDYFIPSMKKLNDARGYSFENLLYDTSVAWKEDGFCYRILSFLPRIKGVSGTTGMVYATTIMDRITYKIHDVLRKMGYHGPLKKSMIGLTSGFGNQLFQYLLYVYLKQNGQRCALCTIQKHLNEHLGLELTRIFPSIGKDVDKTMLDRFIVSFYALFETMIAVCKFKLPKVYSFLSKISPVNMVIFPTWHSYTFIDKIHHLDKVLTFPELDEKNRRIKEMMLSEDAVGIHVRRGDYQAVVKWRLVLGDICDKTYYSQAIEMAYQLFPNPHFYIFSDDMNWVKENLDLTGNPVYIDWNRGTDSYKDLQLMTYSKGIICANSTFSLIAAWLNIHKDAIKIVPSKWCNKKVDDLFERYVPKEHDNWVVVDNQKPQISIIYEGDLGEREKRWLEQQSFTDFEILNSANNTPRGNYVYKVAEIKKFKNHHHLRDWLTQQYTSIED